MWQNVMPQTACCVTTTHTCVWLNSQRAALHTSFPSKKVANLNKKRHSLIVSWPCIVFNGIFKERSYPVCSRGFAPPPSGSYRRTMKNIFRALKKTYQCYIHALVQDFTRENMSDPARQCPSDLQQSGSLEATASMRRPTLNRHYKTSQYESKETSQNPKIFRKQDVLYLRKR